LATAKCACGAATLPFLWLLRQRLRAAHVFVHGTTIDMKTDIELRAKILRLYHVERWTRGTIARQLRVHHSSVSRVLEQEGEVLVRQPRPRKTDAYLGYIVEQLQSYPRLSAARLYDMVKERGFSGQPSQFRALIAKMRAEASRPAEPFQRLSTLPGEQGQVDWAHFGHLQVGRASRPLMAFVLVLSYSRAIYLRFFFSQNLSNFMYGHQLAFTHFGGLPRVCLYDNLKSLVLERSGKAIRFNQQFMAFAGHYRYEPRPVAVARGNEKGRVERSIRYIRDNFFAARRFDDLEDLNRQALQWCESSALARRWPADDRRTVGEALLEEKPKLLALPDNEYPCAERAEVVLHKTPYARFDLNDYSVPQKYVGKTLLVLASLETVRLLDGSLVVATHQRSYDRHIQIEHKEHLEQVLELKSAAKRHHNTTVLSTAVPSAPEFLAAAAERELPLTCATKELLELLHTYGAVCLEQAVREALVRGTPHIPAVRQVLERQRHQAHQPPALPITLPDDPRVKNMHFAPRSLDVYDQLQEKPQEKENDQQ